MYGANMNLPWDLICTFEAVAETGSLSAASHQLGITQPTVGRHIDLLEDQLHVQLFLRGRSGMRLTAKGADLVSAAKAMKSSATGFARIASGLEEEISGTVRISANDVMGVLILPTLLADFLSAHHGIEIELSISNSASNLLQRDADVAIRMFRPKQNDLVARKVAELPLGFYAHQSYLAAQGRPHDIAALSSHRLIGFDDETAMISVGKTFGIDLAKSDFVFRCDNILAQIHMIRAGLGIGLTHKGLAGHWPQVEPVLEHIELPSLELWMVCHSDVRHNKRIRQIMDFLGKQLRSPYAKYNPLV